MVSLLKRAAYPGDQADKGEKAYPCHAEHEGAAILLFVGRRNRMMNHGHWAAPALVTTKG
jgi:hypothetical protein